LLLITISYQTTITIKNRIADIVYDMNKRINFEDDIFLLMVRIRMIRDIITLDADPELFLERTLDDICFLDQSLKTLLGNLEHNHHLIERDELLEQLSNAEGHFSQLLKEFNDHEGNFSIRELPSLVEKIAAFRSCSQERQKAAGKLQPEESQENNIYVGSDELAELLKAF
jgi:hypothetical protein